MHGKSYFVILMHWFDLKIKIMSQSPPKLSAYASFAGNFLPKFVITFTNKKFTYGNYQSAYHQLPLV